ncbi:hypothetical protein BJV82DRAFT_675889 [Fennellomyces sp. T-0311]|nr:hypothetical protein BJV82DRAFT_675889 [Fennellomyces sp. T-0311]
MVIQKMALSHIVMVNLLQRDVELMVAGTLYGLSAMNATVAMKKSNILNGNLGPTNVSFYYYREHENHDLNDVEHLPKPERIIRDIEKKLNEGLGVRQVADVINASERAKGARINQRSRYITIEDVYNIHYKIVLQKTRKADDDLSQWGCGYLNLVN